MPHNSPKRGKNHRNKGSIRNPKSEIFSRDQRAGAQAAPVLVFIQFPQRAPLPWAPRERGGGAWYLRWTATAYPAANFVGARDGYAAVLATTAAPVARQMYSYPGRVHAPRRPSSASRVDPGVICTRGRRTSLFRSRGRGVGPKTLLDTCQTMLL